MEILNSIDKTKDSIIQHISLTADGTDEIVRADRSYRTRRNAGYIVRMPEKYAINTNARYKDAISLFSNPKAYLQAIKQDNRLQINDGLICLDGLPASLSAISNLGTNDSIEDLDLPLLRILYSVILDQTEQSLRKGTPLPQIMTIYVPDLIRFLGKEKSSRNETLSIIQNILRFQSVIGVINGDILPVLVFLGEKQATNTISFASPYITRVIEETYKDSIIINKKGKPITNSSGKPKTKASHSYLIHPSIRNERNKRAVEIVHIIVTLIERSGNHTPHIRALTILEENPLLQHALEGQSTSHQNQILKRSFRRAWELLRTHTDIADTYQGIHLPDADLPESIPTMDTLDMVFCFSHAGKKDRPKADKNGEM